MLQPSEELLFGIATIKQQLNSEELQRTKHNERHPIMIISSPLKKLVILPLIAAGVFFLIQSAFAQVKEQFAENKAVSIKGSVIDASNGTGMAGVIVKISELNIKTKTNQEGAFSFTNIVPTHSGEVTLNANYKGFNKLSQTINLQQAQKITLELKPKPPLE